MVFRISIFNYFVKVLVVEMEFSGVCVNFYIDIREVIFGLEV